MQDTLERACRKWSLWRPGTALRPWLLSIMHNLHVNLLRDWHLDDGHATLDDLHELPDPAAPAGERLDLERALAALPPGQRAVMLLVAVEEYTYAEAAGILDLPIGTVMSRLHRGREALRLRLTPPVRSGAQIVNLARMKR